MDIQKLFTERFEQARKQDQARYFLMTVEKVDYGKKDPDTFRVIGVRTDNNQRVAVFSKKSASGQHLPQVGGIFRADKVKRNASATTTDDTPVYNAEYFHAYGNDSFCMRAVAMAQDPKKNPKNNMWSADVRLFDTEVGATMLDGSNVEQKLIAELARLLKPWQAQDSSSVTHDVRGASIWGDGNTARQGLAPFVVVRSGTKTFTVYGSGAIKGGTEDEPTFSLPTDNDIQGFIAKSQGVANILDIVKSVKAQATPEQMSTLKFSLIPGVQVRVGRESLGGSKQNYLAVPEAFRWTRKDIANEDGAPVTVPGYRMADVHIKMSRSGSMMVVDAAPSAGGRLTQFVPDTVHERALKVAQAPAPEEQQQQAQQQAPDAQPAAVAPQQTKRTMQAPAAAAQAPAYAVPAPNAFDDMESDMDSFGDYDDYASDLAAMQNDIDPANELDSLLDEAAQKQQVRRTARPSM